LTTALISVPLFDEIHGNIGVTGLEGKVERRFLVLIRAVQPFGMALEESFDLFQVTAPDGVVDLVRRSGRGKKRKDSAYKQESRYRPESMVHNNLPDSMSSNRNNYINENGRF
jgi:hypothetical protein